MSTYKECLRCGEPFPEKGEVKNYCSENCRSAAAMKRKRQKEKKFKLIERDLRNNHRILSPLIGKESVDLNKLKSLGFKASLHTGQIKYEGKKTILYYNIGVICYSNGTLKIFDTDGI